MNQNLTTSLLVANLAVLLVLTIVGWRLVGAIERQEIAVVDLDAIKREIGK